MTSTTPTAKTGTALETSDPASPCVGAVATGVVTGDGWRLTLATGETAAGDDAGGLGDAETAGTGLGVGVGVVAGVGVDAGEGSGEGRADGARVGVGVARGVGRGVGRAVGRGVAAAAPDTMIVPVIPSVWWIAQKYGNVPAVANV